MDAKAEKIALFRYGLIAPLVLEALPRGEPTRRAEEIAARQYEIPGSHRTSISVDTLLDWALRYRNGGFEALAPQPRLDRGKSRTITPQLADLIERLKRENPHRTGTTLLRELAVAEAGAGASELAGHNYKKGAARPGHAGHSARLRTAALKGDSADTGTHPATRQPLVHHRSCRQTRPRAHNSDADLGTLGPDPSRLLSTGGNASRTKIASRSRMVAISR
jgi:hypothetical protein